MEFELDKFLPEDDKSLSQRTENLNDEQILDWAVIENEGDIHKILSSDPYLIEGNRGVGKSMLLRFAELVADKSFEKEGIFTVYISFDAALRVEPAKNVQSDFDPTLQWMCMKTIIEIEAKAKKLNPSGESLIEKILTKVGIKSKGEERVKLLKIINETIDVLQSSRTADIQKYFSGQVGYAETGLKVSKEIAHSIIRTLSYPSTLRDCLIDLVESSDKISRIILLYDEAAHALYPKQQALFFDMFKDLCKPTITPKAAVYPYITNYGSVFDPSQDAKKIMVHRYESKDDTSYFDFFKNFHEKRELSKKTYIADASDELLRLFAYLAFGNPRQYINIIESFLDRPFDQRLLRRKIREYVDERYLNDYKRQFESKYKQWSQNFPNANMLEQHVIQKLKEKSEERRRKKSNVSIYFTISDELSEAMSIEIEVLKYLLRISPRGRASTGGHSSAYVFALNPAIAIWNNVILAPQSTAKQWLNELDKMKKETLVMITTSSIPDDLKERLEITPKSIEIEKDVYQSLIQEEIDVLNLSDFILNRLKTRYERINELIESPQEEWMKIVQIKHRRAEKIETALEEYLQS